jgi:hypothetical protein
MVNGLSCSSGSRRCCRDAVADTYDRILVKAESLVMCCRPDQAVSLHQYNHAAGVTGFISALEYPEDIKYAAAFPDQKPFLSF